MTNRVVSTEERIRQIMHKMEHTMCICGCEVRKTYPYYRDDGSKFVVCPCCKRTIEL